MNYWTQKKVPFVHNNINKSTDGDDDGLPDEAEDYEIGTDSKRQSTDGDQFSDGDEYFGINMPQISPADHYFIAAYPKIIVKLVRIDVTPISEIKSMNGESISKGWSIEENTSNSRDFKIDPEAQLNLSPSKLLEGGLLNPEAWAKAANINIGCSLNWKDTYSVAKSDSTSGWNETHWSTATTTDSDRAAKLTFVLEIKNIGNQPAKDISFNLNLLFNNKLIKTIQVCGDNKIPLLGIGEMIELAVDKGGTGGDICVSLNDLKDIDAGASLKIRPLNMVYGVKQWKDNQWQPTASPYSDYLEEVEKCTATLVFDSSGKFYKEFKIYSGALTKPMTLRDAINLTIKEDSDLPDPAEDGTLDILIPEDANEDKAELIRLNKSILDLGLKSGWIIVLRTHKDAAPTINNVKFNKDFSEVSLSVRTDDGIKRVYAKMNRRDGVRKEIEGGCIDRRNYSINLKNISTKDLIESNGKITVCAQDNDDDLTSIALDVPIVQINRLSGPGWGTYYNLSYMGEDSFSGYGDGFLDDISSDNANWKTPLSVILLNSWKEEKIRSGSPLKLKEGYILSIEFIENESSKMHLELAKDGAVVDSKVISPSTANIADKTYYYKKNIGNCEDIVTIAVHFKDAFSVGGQNLATVDAIWQISEIAK